MLRDLFFECLHIQSIIASGTSVYFVFENIPIPFNKVIAKRRVIKINPIAIIQNGKR